MGTSPLRPWPPCSWPSWPWLERGDPPPVQPCHFWTVFSLGSVHNCSRVAGSHCGHRPTWGRLYENRPCPESNPPTFPCPHFSQCPSPPSLSQPFSYPFTIPISSQ